MKHEPMRKFAEPLLLLISLSMMLLGSRCLTQTRYRAIEIPTPRGLDSFSTALNNQGEIVGYYYTVNPPVQTFFTYQDGVLHFLDTTVPGYTMYNASGINDKGQIAFTANIDNSFDLAAFFYDPATGYRLISADNFGANAINNNSQVMVNTADFFNRSHIYFWKSGVLTEQAGWPELYRSGASGFNDDGEIAGFGQPSQAYPFQHAFLGRKGTLTDLTTGPIQTSHHSGATSINNLSHVAGTVLTGPSGNTQNAALWKDGQEIVLPIESDHLQSGAQAINDHDVIVGYSVQRTQSFQAHAAVWENNQVYNLNDLISGGSELKVTYAFAINNKGQILCYADRPDPTHFNGTVNRAVLLTPIRETPVVVNSVSDASAKDASANAFTGARLSDGTREITLRSAIQFANAHSSEKFSIQFNIAVQGIPTFVPKPGLPPITVPIIVDGTTQPGANRIEINGQQAGQLGDFSSGLSFRGGDSEVRGMILRNFNAYGLEVRDKGGVVIQGNYIGDVVPSSVPLFRNRNDNGGIIIFNAPNCLIGGKTADTRNVVAGNHSDGILLFGDATSSCVVEGNYIGTDLTGTIMKTNVGAGVALAGGMDNVVRGNLISGNDTGILLGSVMTIIESNLIGTDATGTLPLGNLNDGIYVQDSLCRIGGDTPEKGNVIAYNGAAGITLPQAFHAYDVAMIGNRIYDNAGLGIDLGGDGPNGVSASGHNTDAINLGINYPQLTIFATGNGKTQIEGFIPGAELADYRVELFDNDKPDASGYGQGRKLIAVLQVKPDALGTKRFSTTLSSEIPDGHVLSATSTDSDGNTSEFSFDFKKGQAAPPSDFTGTLANGGYQINLNWKDNADNETGFILDRYAVVEVAGTAVFFFDKSYSLPANATHFEDSDYRLFDYVFYEVRSVNALGTSSYANPVVLLPRPAPVLTSADPPYLNPDGTYTISVYGKGFDGNSNIDKTIGRINGNDMPSEIGIGGKYIDISVPKELIVPGETLKITAFNPPDDGGVSNEIDYTIPAVTDATALCNIARGGMRYNQGTKRFAQIVTITNARTTILPGQASLALSGLPFDVTLFNRSGTTRTGLPYIDLKQNLAPGESVSVTLQFDDPRKVAVPYSPKILVGFGAR